MRGYLWEYITTNETGKFDERKREIMYSILTKHPLFIVSNNLTDCLVAMGMPMP